MNIRLTEKGKAILRNTTSAVRYFTPKLKKPRYREYTLIDLSRSKEPVTKTKIIIDESRYFRAA